MVSGGSASPRVMPRRPGILASPCACRCNTWHVCTCVCVSVCVRAPARFCHSSCVQKQCLGIVLGRMRQRMNKKHRSALDPRLQNTAHMATPASAWKALWWQPIAKAFPLARTLSDIVQGRHHTAPTPPDTTDPVRARLVAEHTLLVTVSVDCSQCKPFAEGLMINLSRFSKFSK
jgi:hypothetical protein